MSAPRTKRQFAGASSDPAQRRITSFFTSSGSIAATSTQQPDEPSSRGFTAADSAVQANLLSVGMRVRKAVPEGYKTAGYSAFSLWDENKRDVVPTGTTYDAARSSSRANAAAVPTQRELLPFCGIHKVGGLDTQKPSTADEFSFHLPVTGAPLALLDLDTMEDVPGLTLSQESVESNDFTDAGANHRKRFFADEEEEALEIPSRLSVMGWQDSEVSPRSLAPVDFGNGRKMATLRKGRTRGKLGSVEGTASLGQENVMVVDGDFEEASFLDSTIEVDMDDI